MYICILAIYLFSLFDQLKLFFFFINLLKNVLKTVKVYLELPNVFVTYKTFYTAFIAGSNCYLKIIVKQLILHSNLNYSLKFYIVVYTLMKSIHRLVFVGFVIYLFYTT